jgi:DNA-binding NarL/FixJ family response regulator
MPKTQFMIVTVYEDARRIVDALAAGATGYLLKRVGREELLDAITQIHRGGSPMTSSIARKVAQLLQQAPDSPPAQSANLAPREQQVLELIARGYATNEIADQLQVDVRAVRKCVRGMYEKLHVRSRREAAARCLSRYKLVIPLDDMTLRCRIVILATLALNKHESSLAS